MKKFEVYQTAVDSVKDALIEALNNDEETNTLSEIWQHYLGLRAIADKAATDVSKVFLVIQLSHHPTKIIGMKTVSV